MQRSVASSISALLIAVRRLLAVLRIGGVLWWVAPLWIVGLLGIVALAAWDKGRGLWSEGGCLCGNVHARCLLGEVARLRVAVGCLFPVIGWGLLLLLSRRHLAKIWFLQPFVVFPLRFPLFCDRDDVVNQNRSPKLMLFRSNFCLYLHARCNTNNSVKFFQQNNSTRSAEYCKSNT